MLPRYAQWLQHNRLAVYFACTVLTCVCAAGLMNFSFKVDYRTFFASDGLGQTELKAMEAHFPPSDDLAFVLSPKQGDVFTREAFEALIWLKAALQTLSFVESVESITDYPFQYHADDSLQIGYVTEAWDSDKELTFLKGLASTDPIVSGTLFGHSGKSLGLFVRYKLPGENDLVEFPAAKRDVEAIEANFAEKFPQFDLYVAGVLTYNHGIIHTSIDDLILLVPVCSLLIFAILYFFLRSLRGAWFTMIVIGVSLASSVGLWCWLGIPLNSASISAPIAILALAVADCVHISDSYLLSARDNPENSFTENTNQSLILNSKPIFLTSVTSVLGFLTMNFCDSPPYQDIGNLVAIGIGFAWFYSMTLFPVLLGQFGLRQSKAQLHLNEKLHRLSDFICKRYRGIVLGYGLLIVICLACISFNELDDNVVEWFDEDVSVRTHAEFIDAEHTGMYQLFYVVEGQNKFDALNPELLSQVDQFAKWLRTQPEVVQARSVVDLLRNSYSAMAGNNDRLPRDRVMSDQILEATQLMASDEQAITSLITEDRSTLRLHASVHAMAASEFIALEQRVQSWLADNAPLIHGKAKGISPSMMFAFLSQQVVPTMLLTTAIMIPLISLLLIFIFRSLNLGLLSLVPNLIPIGMAFGFWGLFSGHIGIALSIVSGASLGIVVDDTIHLLLKYQRARNEQNMAPAEAVRYAITRVGDALTITTLTLVAGFVTLAFSSLQPNAELGSMLAMIIGLALITDLLFVPALLLWLEERWPLVNWTGKLQS